MSLIELKNVSKIYQVQDEQKYALRDVTLTLPNSGLVAIVGKSGSGKSTILNLIALNDKPSKGEVYFNGENVSKWGSAMVNEYHNRCIGMVFQHYHLLEDETGLLNVMLPMMVLGKSTKRCEEDAKTLFATMGIEPQIYLKKVSEMSGGEKQRICFLRGLINAPYLLLADEPTGALDSKNSILTMELLKQASKKKLVVVVSHNNKLIETYADRIINISDGKVVSDVTINALNNG
ncbi:MAG: ABC transporter ATP-binding protein, partial [Bacilli bacterium]|nr:ABC transporter ATP-binding protein [Bacilli bacterium]